MNPETITTSQIINSFTAKHWCNFIAAIFAVIGAGYWVGQRVAESQYLSQLVNLNIINEQTQNKLAVAQAQIQTTLITSAQMKNLLERSQQTIEEKSSEVAKLTEALGRSNNCAFIHQEIIDTKKALEGTGSMIVLSDHPDWKENQKERKIMLEQRLNGYQQQLGVCNK